MKDSLGNVIDGTVTPRAGGGYQIPIETQDNWSAAESNKFHILGNQWSPHGLKPVAPPHAS